ncbi:hypothetical protein ACHAW5_000625 [Stephanodiscus triporus]|uniref:Fascin n=1 Tax=Stephanodiscus triporus TaxID=2934178 RepID=A0ABD3PVF3_9STRA
MASAPRGGEDVESSSLTTTCGNPASSRPLVLVGAIVIVVVGASALDSSRPRPSSSSFAAAKNLPYYLGKDRGVARTECELDENYSRHYLKRAYDLPFAALFRDTRGQSKFEASDVTIVNDTVYSVCDSSWAISKFGRHLDPFSTENVQIGDPNREEDESGYEAILEFDGLFYVVRESVYHADHAENTKGKRSGDFHAVIEELRLTDDDYAFVRECQCEFAFLGNSKGFEGAVGFPDVHGDLHILGLCEGNHCSEEEEKKKDVGNGRVVIMKKRHDDDDGADGCLWETVRVVRIPESAAFLDYSAIDITSSGRVAITSQEDSSVWLGHTVGISDGVIDPNAFEFNDVKSSVWRFPRDGGCHTIYCNIEGIHFINDEMLMAVSDKMKGKGKQDFRCQEKDQSIHAFVIP